jgi:hypothetical protein
MASVSGAVAAVAGVALHAHHRPGGAALGAAAAAKCLAPKDLSPGWKHVFDKPTGGYFYQNRFTNETSSGRPEEIAQDLGDGWTQYTNLDGGRAYFYNRFSGKAQLYRPDPNLGHGGSSAQYW